ncbi:hypothetical protein [Chryseobacterium paludis]|uniref:hypothetical protein n=1 Tax=Chryseobacterium paludis TaxID=2956784 RepID=UPI0021BE2725|nr:hypothetical protein [Chryseobacterium paludis]
MKIKLFPILSILSMFYGCGFGNPEWRIDQLYVQKIEGTSKVIYNFSAWGGLDSNPHGYIILDSSKTFKVEVEKILPFYNLSNIPSKYDIEGVSHECYGTCGESYYKSVPIFKPIKTINSKDEDINLTNRIYQYRGYSDHENGLQRFVFENFKETKDSLFFYNLDDIESMNGIHLDELKLKKGDIYLQLGKNTDIKKIIADEVIIHPKTKLLVKIRHISLTPKHKISNTEISERGIFREAKIPK